MNQILTQKDFEKIRTTWVTTDMSIREMAIAFNFSTQSIKSFIDGLPKKRQSIIKKYYKEIKRRLFND